MEVEVALTNESFALQESPSIFVAVRKASTLRPSDILCFTSNPRKVSEWMIYSLMALDSCPLKRTEGDQPSAVAKQSNEGDCVLSKHEEESSDTRVVNAMNG